LGASFTCSLLVVGATVYSFGLYVVPFAEAFGLTRAQANTGMMMLNVGIAVWSPIAGSLLDRVPAARVVVFGGAMLGVALCTIANASSLVWIGVAIAGPLAASIACAGPLAASTVVARWFRRRRGRAMGITAVSTAAGGFVMTQVGAYLILHYGWRSALTVTGIGAALLIACLALFFVRSDASEDDLRSGGELIDPGDSEGAAADEIVWSARELVSTPNFWLIAFGAGMLMASDQALLISKIPYLLDMGIELQAASFLVACQSASSMAGKLGIGFSADRVDLRKLFVVVAGAHLFVLAALILKPGYWTLLVVFCGAGVAIGGVHPILTTLIAVAFGSKSYGSVYGRMNLVLMSLALLALYFIGAVYDRTASYDGAFWTFGVVVFLSCFLIGFVRLRGDATAADGRAEGQSA
jgi:MFS family permease